MDAATRDLLLDAERQAQRLSSYTRAVVVVAFARAYIVLISGKAPPSLSLAVLGGLLCYLALAFLAIAITRSRWFASWIAIPFTIIDVLVYGFMVLATLRALDLPPSQFGAVPPFLVLFVLLALAGMRYSPAVIATALLTGALFIVGIAAASRLGWLKDWRAAGLSGPALLFAVESNIMRFGLVLGTGLLIGISVHRARETVVRAIEVTRRTLNLSRYLPPAIADLVGEQGVAALSRGRMQTATVLFADIKGFTSLSETMLPPDIGRLLSDIRDMQIRIVEEHDGIIDKFMGDCAMAVFGVPEPGPHDAQHALSAGMAMIEEQVRWNAKRANSGEASIELGIGIHSGKVFAGAVGSETRLEFTVLGDTVNVAQRIERLTRTLGVPLLASRAALDAAGVSESAWQPMPAQSVKGRSDPVVVFRPRTLCGDIFQAEHRV
jgi:adenylate cyclase